MANIHTLEKLETYDELKIKPDKDESIILLLTQIRDLLDGNSKYRK